MIAFQTANLAMLFLFYHPPSFQVKQAEHGNTKRQLPREFDWVGLFLFLAGCTLWASVGGETLYPWVSGTTLAPIIIGLLTLVDLVVYETFTTLKEPLFPPRLLRAKRYFNTTLWPRLSQLLYAGDEISKGLFASVLPLGTIIGVIIVSFSKYIGHQRWQVVFAVALQAACVDAMSTATIDNSVQSIILTCIISLCTSVNILNGMVLVGFGIVYQEDIGTAAGLAGTSRLLAGAVATAIFSNFTNNKYATSLPSAVLTNVSSFNLPTVTLSKLIVAAKANTAAAYQAVPGITPAIRAAATLGNKQAYLQGAHLSYQVALAFGLLGVICAFIPSIDHRKYTDRTVAVQQRDRKELVEKKMAGSGA
ncbi:hypothetical protein PMIN06_011593 [Paraphaeosphaeria minitans]